MGKKQTATSINQKRPAWRLRFDVYLEQHGHALVSSLGRLLRTPWSTFMTLAVITVAITLATSFYALVVNIHQATSTLQYSHHLSVFLKPEISDRQGTQLAHQLASLDAIANIDYIDKAQGLAQFRQYSGFGEALDALTENPLPGVVHVMPKAEITDQQLLTKLEQKLTTYPEVDFVQIDVRWVQRLKSFIDLARRGVLLIASLLALAVIFIIGNTIRLELNDRRDEVLIAKLVGATDAFIRRPFLYTGLWLGLLSGLAAWILVTFILLLLEPPIERLSNLYDSDFQVIFLGFLDSISLIALSTLLGVFGAGLVLQRQLWAIQPE